MARARYYPWSMLDISGSSDLRDIKRAYAAKLKAIDVETNQAAFLELREAFEEAKRIAAQRALQSPQVDSNVSPQTLMLADPSLDFQPTNLPSPPRGKLQGAGSGKKAKISFDPPQAERSGVHDDKSRFTAKEPTATRESDAAIETGLKDEAARADPLNTVHLEALQTKPDDSPEHPRLHLNYQSNTSEDADDDVVRCQAILDEITAWLESGNQIDDVALERLVQELNQNPHMLNIAARENVETRIAALGLNAGERGHSLLLLANTHFGWHEAFGDVRLTWPMSAVADIVPALQQLQKIKTKKSSAYNWLIDKPPSRLSPIYWIRSVPVFKLIKEVRLQPTQLFHLLGQEHVLAWERGQILGVRALFIAAFIFFGFQHWTAFFYTGPVLPLSPIGFGVGAAVIVVIGVIFAEGRRYRQEMASSDRAHSHNRPILAFVGLGLLTLLMGLLAPNKWIAFLSVPATMLIFAVSGVSVLRGEPRQLVWLAERRMSIGALLILFGLSRTANPIAFVQYVIPGIFFCWVGARLHRPMQEFLDRHAKPQRWQLQLVCFSTTMACLTILAFIFGKPQAAALNFPVCFFAILIVVLHDMITPRNTEIPGTVYIILPIFTACAAVLFPVVTMMTIVALRSAITLGYTWASWRTAKKSGYTWYDSGLGYSSGVDWSHVRIFGVNLRFDNGQLSGWALFLLVIFVLNFVGRLLNNLN